MGGERKCSVTWPLPLAKVASSFGHTEKHSSDTCKKYIPIPLLLHDNFWVAASRVHRRSTSDCTRLELVRLRASSPSSDACRAIMSTNFDAVLDGASFRFWCIGLCLSSLLTSHVQIVPKHSVTFREDTPPSWPDTCIPRCGTICLLFACSVWLSSSSRDEQQQTVFFISAELKCTRLLRRRFGRLRIAGLLQFAVSPCRPSREV